MIGKLFALTAAAVGVMGQAPQAVAGPGGTEIINVPQGATVIIIATNSGGGASWQNVNPSIAGTPAAPQTHQVSKWAEPSGSTILMPCPSGHSWW